MAGCKIVWTPIGESATESIDFAAFGLQRLAGGVRTDAARQDTPAGRAVVVFHDVWSYYELHVDGISRSEDGATWLALQSFLAHAQASAEFAVQVDSAKTYNSTLTVGIVRGNTSCTVGSTTGLSAGDTIVLEHPTDPRRQMTTISGPPTPTTFTISPGAIMAFPNGSAVRHFQYMPRCRALEGEILFVERDAGLGANLWDLRLRFRTFRG